MKFWLNHICAAAVTATLLTYPVAYAQTQQSQQSQQPTQQSTQQTQQQTQQPTQQQPQPAQTSTSSSSSSSSDDAPATQSSTPAAKPAPQEPQSQSTGVQQPADTSADQNGNPNNTDNTTATPPKDATAPVPKDVKDGKESDVNAVGNRKVGHGLDMYSMDHEIAIGKQLAQEVDRTAKFITDPVVTEYVNRVGQNLVRNSDAQVPFTIKVIDSDQVNAFALPGGFFYEIGRASCRERV